MINFYSALNFKATVVFLLICRCINDNCFSGQYCGHAERRAADAFQDQVRRHSGDPVPGGAHSRGHFGLDLCQYNQISCEISMF